MATNFPNIIQTGGGGNPEVSYYGTAAPTSTINYVAGDVWYVTPLGTQADSANATAQYRFDGTNWVKTPGGSAIDIKPSLAPVLDILSTPPTTPNDQDSYIVKATATGAWVGKEGDIATWDAANSVWEFKSPANLDKTTVTTGVNAGFWQYNSNTDSWVQVQQGVDIPTPSLSVAAGNIKFPSLDSHLTNYSSTTPIGVIQNKSVWVWGDDVSLSAGDVTSMASLPRQTSVSYNNLVDGSYTKLASNYPEFVDFVWNDSLALAIDSNGKLWAQGTTILGSGLTTTPTGTTAVSIAPQYAWYNVSFFNTISDKIAKVYMPSQMNATSFSMVITQAGDGYVTGANGSGQLGLGNTTSTNNWVKYPINNLKYAILGANYIVAVTFNGDVYYSGNENGSFTGSTGNKSTPVLVTTGAATYEKSIAIAPASSASTIWVVKSDGTLFAGGNNTSGQQGRGNTTAVVGCTQVNGITNAKFVVTNKQNSDSVALVKTDNSVSFAGLNRDGRQGYSINTSAVNNTTFVTPTGLFQGIVADVLHGFSVNVIRTADGKIYTAGNNGSAGTGRGTTTNWNDQNKFKEIAFPTSVVGMLGIFELSASIDGFLFLSNVGSIYGFGSPILTKYNASASRGFSPIRIPMWGDTGEATVDNLLMAADYVGDIQLATASSVTTIIDGVNGQNVTFTVNYTGGVFGLVDLTGSTVTGPDITQVSLTTTSVVISGASGSFTVSFVINAADVPALVPPNTQAQDYVLTLLINGN